MTLSREAELHPEPDNNGNIPPAAVSTLAKNIMAALDRHYPKFTGTWNIKIDTHAGMVTIRNVALSGRMGFYIKIVNIDERCKAITDAAGELFERYNVARSRGMGIKRALADVQRSFTGEAIDIGS